MTDPAPPSEAAAHVWTEADHRIGLIRLATGLLQGLAYYLLSTDGLEAWRKGHEDLTAMAWPLMIGVPMLVLAGVGRMRPRVLWPWIAAAFAGLAGMGLYQHWSLSTNFSELDWMARYRQQSIIFSWAPVWTTLYILHHLIEGCDAAGKLRPDYRLLFDRSWRRAFQLGVAISFAFTLIGLLYLGGALFKLVGANQLADLVEKEWFRDPLWFAAFAVAVHLTDVRPALIQGVRSVVLTLNAWLLPVIVALASGFLLLLPFTGLEKLWATKAATAIVLSVAGNLVILINAAYQDGDPARRTPKVLQMTGRLGAVLLTPLTLIAAYAIWLRIGQYGLTPQRVIALAVLFTSAAFAAGYLAAALRRGPWLKLVEPVNIATALLISIIVVSLFSAVADPRRLAVDNQIARLLQGKVKPDAFDYRFLRFKSGRFGEAALRQLAASDKPDIAARARVALARKFEFDDVFGDKGQVPGSVEPPLSHAVILPRGAVLPEGFKALVKSMNAPEKPESPSADIQVKVQINAQILGPDCLRGAAVCTLVVRDLDHDGAPEVIVSDGAQMLVYGQSSGQWTQVGSFLNAGCRIDTAQLETMEAVRPLYDNLIINGARMSFSPTQVCQPLVKPSIPVKK